MSLSRVPTGDLPIRMGELGIVHRHEKSGQMHGLMRVRCFTQDDAHIFMTPEQVKDEIKGVATLIDEVYKMFGFKYHVELSTRPEDSMGSDEDWKLATDALRDALDSLGMDYVVNEGDGAFYGPKSTFIWKTPSDGPGSAEPSSSTSSFRCALTWNIQEQTERSTARL